MTESNPLAEINLPPFVTMLTMGVTQTVQELGIWRVEWKATNEHPRYLINIKAVQSVNVLPEIGTIAEKRVILLTLGFALPYSTVKSGDVIGRIDMEGAVVPADMDVSNFPEQEIAQFLKVLMQPMAVKDAD